MKKVILLVIAFTVSIPAISFAQYQYVHPYVRSDGTFVQGHYRTEPNGTTWDNWSTRGNTNPFTGRQGYVDPYGQGSTNRQNPYSDPYRNKSVWDNND
jgi:hypothetical protein